MTIPSYDIRSSKLTEEHRRILNMIKDGKDVNNEDDGILSDLSWFNYIERKFYYYTLKQMIYVEKIKIVEQSFPGSHVLDKDFTIECEDINLFVGDQGCGKSTMLQLMQQNHDDIKLKMSDFVIKNGVNTFFFDSEKDNPRTKDPQLYTTPSGKDKGIGFIGATVTKFQSHGEVLENFVIDPLLKAKDCVIMLDEPESALSITNQFKLINAIKTAIKNNCQLFIATHCYPLIEKFNVISLEHNKQMSGIEFIKKIKSNEKS